MKNNSNDWRSDKFEALGNEILERIAASTRRSKNGTVSYLIGNNGTGKSRMLAHLMEQLREAKPARNVACISNGIYDRFKHTDEGRVVYLGARNAPNAVFHAATDRLLSRLILQALQIDRTLLKRLSTAVNMDFSFAIGRGGSIESEVVKQAQAVGLSRRRKSILASLVKKPSLNMLERIAASGGNFESLTRPQNALLQEYLKAGIDFTLKIGLANGSQIDFGDLSSGEQNRTLLFAKVISALRPGTVFLIDEPEVSLHLHWQMGFHEKLMELLDGLSRYHVVVATHAPIVISQAAKAEPNNEKNVVFVMQRKLSAGQSESNSGPGKSPMTYYKHTFAEVASHDYLVVRLFKTAPYHAHEVSAEIADAVLRVIEGHSTEGERMLREFDDVEGLTPEALSQIAQALDLIKRKLLRPMELKT